jgi:hypothetical protein
MTDTSKTDTSLDEQAKLGWKVASDLFKPFGSTAANFAEAIRVLTTGFENSANPMSTGAQNHIIRLLKNTTMKATYFYFAKQFRPSAIENKEFISEKDLFNAFTPFEHAAIISLCYLFKTLSRKIDKEEWEYVQTPLYEALAIGASVGQHVSQVGVGIGLLSHGIRYLALAPLLRENRRAFKEYRQHLKAKDLAFDTTMEEKLWQCSSIQIAAILLEHMGFQRSFSLQYIAAATRDPSVKPDAIYGIPMRIAESLIDSYMEGNEVPTSLPAWVGLNLDLPAEVRGNLVASLNKALADKNRIEWLNKGSSSIDPISTPELFSQEERAAAAEGGTPPQR